MSTDVRLNDDGYSTSINWTFEGNGPKMLTGITNAENSVKKDEHGKSPEKLPPTVIGDKELAKQVYLGGQERGQQIAFSADAVLQATNKLLVKHDDKP